MKRKSLLLTVLLLPLFVGAITPDMLLENHRLLRVQSDLPGFTVKTIHALTGSLPQIAVQIRPEKFPRTWQIINFWGECCAKGDVPVGAASFTIPQVPRGHYTLIVKKGDSLYQRTVFAVIGEIPAKPKLPSPFATNVHFSHMLIHPDFAAVIRAAGITQVRDTCYWNIAEKKKGIINPDEREVQMVFNTTKDFSTAFICCYGNRNYDRFSAPHTPEGFAAWKRYVQWLPKYFPQCHEIEVWNEFNCAFLLRGAVAPTPENYLELSKATYEAVKEAAPDMPVIGCSTSLIPWSWLEKFYQLGGLKYLDIVSCHPYRWGKWDTPPETLCEDMLRLRKLIDKYANGRHIPIYANEYGWPCGAEWGVTPEMQAVYLPRAYASLIQSGVARGYWFKMILHPNEREQWQMVKQTNRNCYLPDPAYASFSAITRELLDAQFVRAIDGIAPGRGLEFNQNGQKLYQLWGTEDSTTLELSANGSVEVKDLFGASKILEPVDGKVYLFLRNATVYVRGNVTSIATGTSTTCRMVGKPVSGSPLKLSLLAPQDAELRLRDQSFPQDSEPRLRGLSFRAGEISLADDGRSGGCGLAGTFLRKGKLCGLLFYEYEVQPQMRLLGMRLNANGDLVASFVNSLPERPLRLTRFVGSVDGKPVSIKKVKLDGRKIDQPLDIAVPATVDVELVIPKVILDAKPFELNVLKAEFHFDKHQPVQGKETVTYAPCQYRRRFKSIYDPQDWENMPFIDIEAYGTQIREFFGQHVCDHLATTKGKIWLAWNENELLLTACFDDPSHSIKLPGWQGDSIQFAFGQLRPGIETSQELLAFFNDKKNQSCLFPSMTPAGFDGDAVTREARCNFSRQGNQTIYMMAIPWEVLPFLSPAPNKPFRFSLLVNGSDHGGPRGGLCWGDGIWATKGSKQYPVCVFEK